MSFRINDEIAAYIDGRSARSDDKARDAQSIKPHLKASWLSGWDERDRELKDRENRFGEHGYDSWEITGPAGNVILS
jgi:hypothetical protein